MLCFLALPALISPPPQWTENGLPAASLSPSNCPWQVDSEWRGLGAGLGQGAAGGLARGLQL